MRPVGRALRRAAVSVGTILRVPVRRPVEFDGLSLQDLVTIQTIFHRRKFFLLGYPRSGTTLLGRLLRLHPEVHCNWQAHFFTQSPSLADLIGEAAIAEWLGRHDNRWTKGAVGPAHLIRVACDYILERQAEGQGAWIVGDKSPDETSWTKLETLNRVYPDAKVIYIVRDGRDVAVSRRYQQFIDLPHTMSGADRRIAARLASRGGSAGARLPIFTPGWLEREARQWADDVIRTDREAARRFGDRYRRLRFEDLLQAPAQVMKDLWTFLGVKEVDAVGPSAIAEEMARNPAADWHAEVAQTLVSGLRRASHGAWRESFTAADQQLFESIATDALAHWGFSV